MTTKSCGKRKHTPIVSQAQRRLFGAALSGKSYAAPGLSKQEAYRHLKEVKGRKLPEERGRNLSILKRKGVALKDYASKKKKKR